MRLNCVNILKMPGLARFGPHPLGAGPRRRFRTSAALWRQDRDESRLDSVPCRAAAILTMCEGMIMPGVGGVCRSGLSQS